MITAIGKDENGGPLVYLGLTPENVRRMVAGEAVSVPAGRLREMGLPNPIRIVIAAVENYEQGVAQIMETSPDVRRYSGDPVRPMPAAAPAADPPGTTRLPAQACPVCKYTLDAATDPKSNAQPAPGDATVCINCASFLMFGEGLTLREMSLEEVANCDVDTLSGLKNARRHIEQLRGRRR